MNENITFRLEKEEEYREVENLVRDSFWNVYKPGCIEHFLLRELRKADDFVKELDIVMLKDNKIIGQNVFVKANIYSDDGKIIPIMTMGPICISNELKRQGYGKMLLDYSLEKAKELGCSVICIEGNIDFYGKSGFTFGKDFNIRYNDMGIDDDTSFFLCNELIPGTLNNISGYYKTPDSYMVSEEECEEYDKEFPYKEKLKLPGQLF